MKKLALYLLLVAVVLSSCSSDDNSSEDNQLIIPPTYQFTRDGNSTVNYIDETNGILMANQFITALVNVNRTETELQGMYNNTGNYFSTSALNESPINLRGKTAASQDYFSNNASVSNAIRSDIDGWITNQVVEVFPNWAITATSGTAGKLTEADNITVRRVSAKGVQYAQLMGKVIVGSFMIDQILNNNLSVAVLDAGNNRANNDNDVLLDGSNYTAMEHKWDEAFGYAYGLDNAQSPQLNQDFFLNKYISRVENDSDFAGIADDIYSAFKIGRAAIVAKDYDLRDEQADIIKEKLSLIIGIRSVFYLRQGVFQLETDKARAFHELSEAYGFIYALQFTRQPGTISPYFTKAEVDAYLAQLMIGNGFWDVTDETLNQIATAIANRFNFSVEEAEFAPQ
ncbi:DUF4856 domain-containing protein [Winogradskyella forsetii]|uniref:DUF4856 domain-containing protein n=1 Tax=Winogradskyella forsetii TaxID=2686077 RepID=UPI0015B8D74E|nr:DUF4856 domain-containing protein [Winogradskyella forsetii]